MERVRWLTKREARAWRGYLRMRTLLDLQTSRDLADCGGLSDADYHVLATLSATPDQMLRMLDLAKSMLWSTSRLAHHLDRMAARGLVRREPHPTNSRAAIIVMTETGRRAIEEAAPHHVASVRRNFVDLLTREQLDTLGDIADIVVHHLAHDHDTPVDNTPARAAYRTPGA